MSQTPNPPPGDSPARRRRGRYPSQFLKGAAALVLDQRRTIAEVARELGVNEQTLGNSRAPGTHRPR
ncbi:transposase [Acidimicrobium ferrooxidans]|uniref:transposase n=1 Tax=Acidimicrobium ferrooxidans TaxID=53635 RepID=UPI00019DE334|nr:transposase [Acidimicrobium ferrooxidans]